MARLQRNQQLAGGNETMFYLEIPQQFILFFIILRYLSFCTPFEDTSRPIQVRELVMVPGRCQSTLHPLIVPFNNVLYVITLPEPSCQLGKLIWLLWSNNVVITSLICRYWGIEMMNFSTLLHIHLCHFWHLTTSWKVEYVSEIYFVSPWTNEVSICQQTYVRLMEV